VALLELEERIASAVEAIAPSVAIVEALHEPPGRRGGPPGRAAAGSAVVTERGGLLVTNHHVVEGAGSLTVRLADGRDLPGTVLGGDAVTDLALVRVDAGDLPAAPWGDSETLRVGQIVLAVGNALALPGGPTVSLGVVSALRRPLPGSDFIFEGLLQTDAAVNPGNSGGPLVDLSGKVVGINTAVAPFAQGVGFAIPIHAVARISEELRRKGRIVRPWVGVSVAELGPELARQHALEARAGLWVAEVVPRSPAHRGGIRPGDVLVRVGPFEVRTVRELVTSLAHFPVGADVTVGLVRRGAPFSTSLPLQETPRPLEAR
jgi:serine protease Do